MASGLKAGDRVKVANRLHILSEVAPEMQVYKGQEGTISVALPAEMSLGRMYRVEFDNPDIKPKAFLGRELIRI